MKWIHPEQGALLRMCHFDGVLDTSGIVYAFLITRCDPKVFSQVVLKEYCTLHLAADTVTT